MLHMFRQQDWKDYLSIEVILLFLYSHFLLKIKYFYYFKIWKWKVI